MGNASKLKDAYMNWVKEEYDFTDVSNNYVAISTPFIDSMHDNIEISAKVDGNNILLTDLGETIFNLESQGFLFNRKNTKSYTLLHQTLNDFNIQIDDGELFVYTTIKDLGNAKIRLLQTIMRLNDIPYLMKNNNGQSFVETAERLLTENDIPFNHGMNIQAGVINPHFDFSISKYKNIHPKFVRAIARPGSNDQTKAFTFDVQELQKENRPERFILMTDSKNNPKSLESMYAITSELSNTEIVDISNKEKAIQQLIA